MFKKFAHFTNWDFHLSVYKKEFKTGAGSEDLHPLVLSQGGICLNRAAQQHRPTESPLFYKLIITPPARGHISNERGWAEHIHWKSELIISGPRSSRCDRNIYWPMIVEKTHCITFFFIVFWADLF